MNRLRMKRIIKSKMLMRMIKFLMRKKKNKKRMLMGVKEMIINNKKTELMILIKKRILKVMGVKEIKVMKIK